MLKSVSKSELIIFCLLLLTGIAVRVILFTEIPPGLNQDEASIGYDAFALLHYGTDRNGYANPVYFISWGSGQNALYAYLSMPFIRVFGLSVFSVRFVNLLFAIISLPVFYLLVRKLNGRNTAMTALFLLTVSPWHIMISRWGLESNLLPAVFMIAVYLFVLAGERGSTALYCISAVVFALTLYAYSAVTIILPVFLAALCIYAVRKKMLSVKQLMSAGICFVIFAIPMVLFYMVNLFGFEEINTAYFSVAKFTSLRSSASGFDIFGFLRFLVFQNDSLPWNVINGFGVYYLMLIPFTMLGIICIFMKKSSAVMNIWFICGLLLGFIVQYNINRVNLLWIPMIYITSTGLQYLFDKVAVTRIYAASGIAIFFVLFVFSYFGTDYRSTMEQHFNAGFDEVITAQPVSNAEMVYMSGSIHGAYMLTLFYTQPDPRFFYDTVEYMNPGGEFRHVNSFDKYIFSIPPVIDPSDNAVYIIKATDDYYFDSSYFNADNFGNFLLIQAIG